MRTIVIPLRSFDWRNSGDRGAPELRLAPPHSTEDASAPLALPLWARPHHSTGTPTLLTAIDLGHDERSIYAGPQVRLRRTWGVRTPRLAARVRRHQHSSTHAVGEALGYVQGASLKPSAAS